VIGPGRAIDTDRWFVVCVNVLGGCQGTTGPASPHPDDGRPWASRFPVVTIRDMVRTQAAVADHLGIDRWALVAGGSMGGMQVLEWGVMYPERVRALLPIATAAAASAQQIGWWSSGRRTISMDPGWRGGEYYDAGPGGGPHEGLATARMVSMMTFRSDDVFSARFGREVVEPVEGFSLWQRFQVERYLEYQGHKLVRRFDANSYLLLTKAMDLHDLGRGRGGTVAAMSRLRAPVLAIGVESDILYPLYQSQEIVAAARANGLTARSVELDSPHGHDAFLIEHDQVGTPLAAFLDDVEHTDA
jgi:homoserine O-acetyltransferase